VPAVPFGRVDAAQPGAVGEHRFPRQTCVLLEPPEEIRAAFARLAPHPEAEELREAEELAIRQTRHAVLQILEHRSGESDFACPITVHPAGEQHMRAVLHQRDEADLRVGGSAAAGPGATERRVVRPLVGDVQRAAPGRWRRD
jgi:hypothetical protein